MRFDLDAFKRVTGHVDLEGIDFDSFGDHPLAPEHLQCVRYMHDVEQHTACYLRNLLNTRAHHDPDVTAFLTLWNYEEYWHGDALARVLAAHHEPAGTPRIATMRRRMGWRLTVSPVVWMAFSASTRHFLAVHMAFGAINEWTTQAGYARLATLADHDTLRQLLRRIMRQEGRHIDYYASNAARLLAVSPAARRTTRALIRTLWNPVGAKVMPLDDTRQLIRTLFATDGGPEVATRLDRRVDSLPGLGGMHLMTRALARYAA